MAAPFGYCAAMPPATASPPCEAANSRATRRIAFAPTSTAAAICSGAYGATSSRMRAMSAAGMRDAGTREGGGPSRSFRNRPDIFGIQ